MSSTSCTSIHQVSINLMIWGPPVRICIGQRSAAQLLTTAGRHLRQTKQNVKQNGTIIDFGFLSITEDQIKSIIISLQSSKTEYNFPFSTIMLWRLNTTHIICIISIYYPHNNYHLGFGDNWPSSTILLLDVEQCEIPGCWFSSLKKNKMVVLQEKF